MQDRVYKTQAVVLRRYEFGETGKQLVIYTPGRGKLSVLAKGVKRITSKLAGHLEPLTLSLVVAARGRNLDTVTGAETVESFARLRTEPERLFYGMFVTELLDKLTPEHEESRALWDLFLQTLRRVDAAPDPWLAVTYFQVRLLVLSGYKPEVGMCVECQGPLDPRSVYYSPRLGGALCPQCRLSDSGALAVSANAIKVLRLAAGSTYSALERVAVKPPLRVEVDALLRENLRRLLEVELRSTELLETLGRRAP